MRVVHAEHQHAVVDPEQDDVADRLPERRVGLPVVEVVAEVDDVLVLLRGVLGVLDRPVGAPLEPVGVLLDPGMVGRGIEREVERQLDALGARGVHERVEVLQRAELGVDGGEAPLGRADGVGGADVARLGAQRVVPALAVGAPDRVDRREVKDVEAQAPDVVELADHVAERAVDALRALRAGQHLVPGAERRGLAVGEKRQGAGVAAEVRARLGPAHQRHRLGLHERVDRALGPPGELPERALVAAGALERGAHQSAALLALDGDVLAGGDLLGGVAVPGAVEVAPGGEGVLVVAGRGDRQLAAPAIVDDLRHLDLGPLVAALGPPHQRHADDLVAVGEGVRLDAHGPAGDAFGGEAARVDLRIHPLDDEPRAGQLVQVGVPGRRRGLPRPGPGRRGRGLGRGGRGRPGVGHRLGHRAGIEGCRRLDPGGSGAGPGRRRGRPGGSILDGRG